MKRLANILLISIVFTSCTKKESLTGMDSDRQALEATSIGIRSAFAEGDIPTILSYHHPNVRKALGYNHIVNGREELEEDLQNTFRNVSLTWLDNNVESLIFQGNTAIEMTAFTIQATPKDSGSMPNLFKGRAMVVYVRDKQSPSGWASIREVIQPEAD